MTEFRVNTQNPYDVVVECGIIDKIGERLARVKKPCKVLLVTDSNVAQLYAERATKALEKAGFAVCSHVFAAGEKNKTPGTYLGVISALAQNGLIRSDAVVALGGGVVGDVAGFAAATYMRGIAVVQVPTTLLAAIDSSVGGKTGVDLPQGKNLLGAFHQPVAVLCDPDTLNTLGADEWKSGFGEGVKYGVLCGGRILELLREGVADGNVEEFVMLCAKAKADVVESDEKEGGARKLLNLGHTIGHAIEQASNFSVPHGVAVAAGIRRIAECSVKRGELSQKDFDIIVGLLQKYSLEYVCDVPSGKLAECAVLDKKRSADNSVDMIKIKGIGRCEVVRMSLDEFRTYIG